MAAYNTLIVGEILRVRITSVKQELGAFARMPNGVDGLIRLHDMLGLQVPKRSAIKA